MNINKIVNNRWILRSIFKTIWFNFHYLPFKQAIKLPILLYKPKLLVCKGSIKINAPISFGMITLGKYCVSIYPNSGIVYENWGGVITFNGKCSIGNASAISVGNKGKINFGENFSATAQLKLVSYHQVYIHNNVLIGWNCMICDTNFHKLSAVDSSVHIGKGFGCIEIGQNTWIAMNCTILSGTSVAEYSVIGANSTLTKKTSTEKYSLLSGNPASIIKKGIFRDRDNDRISYD